MRTNIFLFLAGTELWYITELIFRSIVRHQPPALITCFIAGLALVLINTASNHKTNSILSGLEVATIITGCEYFLGVFYWYLFNIRLWDYSGMFMNLNGFITLKYSLVWWIVSASLIFLFKKYKNRKSN